MAVVVPGPAVSMPSTGRAAVIAALVIGLGCGLAGCVSSSKTTSGNVGFESTGAATGKDGASTSDENNTERLVSVRMDLASAYFARGQNKDALDEVKQVIALKPDSGTAYALRGLIYAAMGDPATAEDSFHHSLSLAPHNGDTMHNFGWFLCQQRRFADADKQFADALAEPTYHAQSRTLLAQGVCQARGGNLAESEHTLSRSYELDPANPTTAVNLSDVLYQRGDYERALFYIRRVNTHEELVSAQTLWLAARIERKLGQETQVQAMGAQLHDRFPQSPETLLFDKGQF